MQQCMYGFTPKTNRSLCNKRGLSKKTYPGLWDVSVAGHVHAGESITTGAIREVEKKKSDWKSEKKIYRKSLFEKGCVNIQMEFKTMSSIMFFWSKWILTQQLLKKQDEEVEAIQLFDLEILKGTNEQFPMVPNTSEYFQFISQNIESILS